MEAEFIIIFVFLFLVLKEMKPFGESLKETWAQGPGPKRDVDPDSCHGASTPSLWRRQPLSSPGHFRCVVGGEVAVTFLSRSLPRPPLPSWAFGGHVDRGLGAWPASWSRGQPEFSTQDHGADPSWCLLGAGWHFQINACRNC